VNSASIGLYNKCNNMLVQLPLLLDFKRQVPPVNAAWILWVNRITMLMNVASLFVLSTSVMPGLLKGTVMSVSKVQYHRVCYCRIPDDPGLIFII